MADKKGNELALLEILKRYSDEDHILTQPELLERMQGYGYDLDRRTLYSSIETLQRNGYDISTYRDNGKGYFLESRLLEKSEVIMLSNSIHANTNIPEAEANALVNKLFSTLSRYEEKAFREKVYLPNRKKKKNRDFFLNIEIINEAIRDKVCVVFDYMHYDLNKKLVPRKDHKYVVHPYYMVNQGDKCYLVGKTEPHTGLSHYRIDRIRNMTISEQERDNMSTLHEDPYEYAQNKLFMYGGDEEWFTLRCHISILDNMIDTFGTNVSLSKDDEEHFSMRVQSTRPGIIYLALQYMKYMEITDPADARDEVKKILDEAVARYGQ